MPPNPSPSNAKLLMRYAGLAFQFLATIGLGIWLGSWLDSQLAFSFPWCAFSIPVILVIGMLVQVVRDTGKKNRGQKNI